MNLMYFSNNVVNINTNVNIMHQNFIDAVKKMQKQHTCILKKSYSNFKKPWFNDECFKSKKRLKKLLNICKSNSFCNINYLKNYNNAKNNHRKFITSAKKLLWKLNLLSKAQNASEFWKTINKFRRKKGIENVISLGDCYNHLQKNFPIFAPVVGVLSQNYDLILDSEISIDELNVRLSKCK